MFLDIPMPAPSSFTTRIDNPFMPLRPGTTLTYALSEDGERVTYEVTRDTREVNGVTCVVVHDIAYVNGLVVEDTHDWFAQDADGNVWYFGEDTAEYEPGNPVPLNNNGAWEAGVDGAVAGIVMLADPAVGQRYYQEYAKGIAEDFAVVKSLKSTVDVVYGSFDDVLKTRDVNPLDPSEERKYHVEGVGTVLTTDEDGAREQLVHILVEGTRDGERLLGYAGGDEMRGKGGDDRMRGLDGNDTLSGNRGNDTLKGGEGFDLLNGGRGDDRLVGGKDGDTFAFRGLSNGRIDADTIADYHRGQLDVLDIRGGVDAIVDQTQVANGWRLTLAGDGDTIFLRGLTDSDGDGQITDQLLFL